MLSRKGFIWVTSDVISLLVSCDDLSEFPLNEGCTNVDLVLQPYIIMYGKNIEKMHLR